MFQKVITRLIISLMIITGLGIAIAAQPSHANTCPIETPAIGTGDPLTATCDVNVSATVDPSISLEIIDADSGDGTDENPYIISTIGVNGSTNIDDPKTFTAQVNTNSLSGYTLTIIDEDEDNSLLHASDDNLKIAGCTTFDGEASCWGIKADYLGSNPGVTSQTDYFAVPISTSTPKTLINYGSSVSSAIINDQTKISIGLSISKTQAAGTYQDRVLITATAK